MNDRLPYEEQLKQQLADLPLADENLAWADMKRRLEEDDDNGIIPIWLRGCGLWGLPAIVLLGIGGWWLFFRNKQESKKQETQNVQKINGGRSGLDYKDKNKKTDSSAEFTTIQPGTNETEDKSELNETVADSASLTPEKVIRGNKISKESADVSIVTFPAAKKNKTTSVALTRRRLEKKNKNQIQQEKDNIVIVSEPGNSTTGTNKPPPAGEAKPGIDNPDKPVQIPDSSAKSLAKTKTSSDTVRLKDSIKKKTPEQIVKNNIPQKDSARPKSVYFSAGIALHQQLPVNGQKLTPYNSQGRKGSLADYIPAVYFRMYKNEKWFIQSEFRYGAPQYNKEILFYQKGIVDTFGFNRTTTSEKLEKTFYHQLPVSFNYFVLPNWSVGGGFVWNKFSAAVSAQDVIKTDLQTGIDTVVSKGVILNTSKADSNFVKSYFQALIETQYRWKRFSFGARYSFGLQPYLKFTLAGASREEKNSTLQVFLRYDIWRSKKYPK